MNTLHFAIGDEYGNDIATIETNREGKDFEKNLLIAVREHSLYDRTELFQSINVQNYIGLTDKELFIKVWEEGETDPSKDKIFISHTSFYGINPEAEITREKFMQFFRSEEFHNKLSPDDTTEIFTKVLHGSTDVTADLLNSIISDYSVEGLEVIESNDDIAHVTWSVKDFEHRAKELEGNEDNVKFNRENFQDALHDMIKNHDASIGICWDTIDIYLHSECKIEPIYFEISGYYTDDKSEFEGYVVKSYDDAREGSQDDDVFYFGLSESQIKEAIQSKEPIGDFVITSYKPLPNY